MNTRRVSLMVRTQGNTLGRRTSHHSVRQLRKVARVNRSSSIRLSKNKVEATPGQAATTEAVALQAALPREVEVATAAEAEARALEEEEVAAAEAKGEEEVAVAATEASTPMLRKVIRAMAAWSTRFTMRHATSATRGIGRRNDCIVWTSTAWPDWGDISLVNADVF